MKGLLNIFRWQDVLDILILTFVFYRLYLRLRRKRALRMILAILALPVFYLIAQWIDLPLSVWSLQNLWAVILLVLVVIFQQEIREVLGSVSLPTFFFGRAEGLTSKVVDKITDAAFQMADKRIGGIIVLQRQDDLEEFIHGETLIDSALNEDILVSVFNPQSPLHDGAVIIQGDRIRYATALLPASQSPSLPKAWGTRHRAGLGITEVSDAECIVISEERKEVLFAHKGNIEKKNGIEELKKSMTVLASYPEGKSKEKGRIQRLFSDLPIKAFFLLIVCLLWIVVVGIRQGEISMNLPIEYYSIPQNLRISGQPPKEIKVRLKGSQKFLSSLNPDHIRAQVNLSKARSGSNQISLSEMNINCPSGMTVTYVSPQNIYIQLSPISNPNTKE